MNHPIRCSCGLLRGVVISPARVNRCVCYCTDCQAFARFLKRDAEILDEQGGTDLVQTLPRHVRFTEGAANLACVRLTENGLLRWYASCCNTPIGNTHPNPKVSFVGLIGICLKSGERSLEDSFGPVSMRAHRKHARGGSEISSDGTAASLLRLMGMILRARLDGSYKISPFFVQATGAPVVRPKVLSAEELSEVKRLA
jgi:hypothetical protein